jgi:hypothetical protein
VGSVTIPANQNVLYDTAIDLVVGVRDTSGNVLNVTPGSIKLSLIDGANNVRLTDGPGVRGLLPGTARVVATVDGVSSPPAAVSVTSNAAVAVTPATITVTPSARQPFAGRVSDAPDGAVEWNIQEGSGGGSITAGGLYTAPSLAGTYHVVATSQFDRTKSGSATVIVPVTLSITPAAATVTLYQQKQFAVTVLGLPQTGVDWSVQEGAAGGQVDATGWYTAPEQPGIYHVIARSKADPTKSASAMVTVTAGNGVVIIQ